MRTIIRTSFNNRTHDSIVEEYCSRFRAKVAIAPQSFERLYAETDEVIFEGEDETPESRMDSLHENSEDYEALPACSSNTKPRKIQYVVVVPVLISFRADGEATRMWDEGPSAEPPHRI